MTIFKAKFGKPLCRLPIASNVLHFRASLLKKKLAFNVAAINVVSNSSFYGTLETSFCRDGFEIKHVGSLLTKLPLRNQKQIEGGVYL